MNMTAFSRNIRGNVKLAKHISFVTNTVVSWNYVINERALQFPYLQTTFARRTRGHCLGNFI